ncbi:hypothetical protein GCM10010385_48730 [Streptomyces geysiriensis]|nr:hypothetical protein GCM10010385_48730 [Streptomyces geysiriensis]
MKAGSDFAYEPTQSMATNGASRQRPMTTRTGVTTGSPLCGGACDMRWLRPLADHLVQCARNVGDGFRTAEALVRISVPNRNVRGVRDGTWSSPGAA